MLENFSEKKFLSAALGHSSLRFSFLFSFLSIFLFSFLFIIILILTCAPRQVKFNIPGGKYWISYDRIVLFPSSGTGVYINVETNYPSEVSVVISYGLFGGAKIYSMYCEEKRKNRFICHTFVSRASLRRNSNFFWFMVKTEDGFYTIPNIYVAGEKIFDVIGEIKISD